MGGCRAIVKGSATDYECTCSDPEPTNFTWGPLLTIEELSRTDEAVRALSGVRALPIATETLRKLVNAHRLLQRIAWRVREGELCVDDECRHVVNQMDPPLPEVGGS